MAILHIAREADWLTALASGEYRVSTLDLGLDEVGFIHASTSRQIDGVAAHFYRDETESLVVLVVDGDALSQAGVPIRYEDPGNGALFPHLFGPITPECVVAVLPAEFDDEGRFQFDRPIDSAIGEAIEAELMLLERPIRGDVGTVDRMLAPDFREFGSSGRSWTRDEILASIGGFDTSEPLTVTDVVGHSLSDDTVLVTYRATRASMATLRSSVWQRSADGWRVVFHQGTPTA